MLAHFDSHQYICSHVPILRGRRDSYSQSKCISLVQVISEHRCNSNITELHIVFLIVEAKKVFKDSVICQHLQAEGVYYAAYNYTWYLLKPNEAKSLLLIMICSERPLFITAGKIFPMTLSMFCNVRHPSFI